MSSTRGRAPPLTPVLVLGLALGPLPLAPLQPLLAAALAAVGRRHPELFARAAGEASPLFLIDPCDLPMMFLFHADADAPSLRAVRDGHGVEATAVIRGPLLALIDLCEGRVDGDTLFFRRDLVFEGDTEAVVTLRNALECAEIDLVADTLAALGPLARPLGRLVALAGEGFSRMSEDLETLRAALIAPAVDRGQRTESEMRRLYDEVASLKKRSRRGRAAGP